MPKREVKTKIGYDISITEFEAAVPPLGIVVISPATGVKQSFYSKFAEFLKSQGYSAITFDFGGIGESKNESLKTFDTSAHNWGSNDLEAVIGFYTKKYPDLPLTIVGHSIGGQIIGLAPSSTLASKIITVASQSGYWKFWKGIERVRMLGNWYIFFPAFLKIFGYFPGKIFSAMEDLPKSMASEWRKWCISPNYLFDHISMDHLNYQKIKCPVYSYSASDDRYAPKEAVDWITAKYEKASITRKHLTPKDLGLSKIGHFGFFKEHMKETLCHMILGDIEKQ